jgi:hypothetical protein
MSKLDLQTKIEGLKKAIAEHKGFTGTYESQLVQAEQQFADINKPELTPMQFDDIYEAVETGVGEFDFSDQDNYNTEFELDYDNRVTLSELELCNHQDLVEMIVEKVSELFTEAECPEELDTTEDDNHPVEKLQN